MKADVGDAESIANADRGGFQSKQGFSTDHAKRAMRFLVFGQTGKWNRIGAYIVHVALLTLFLGYFVANQTGFNAVSAGAGPEDKSDRDGDIRSR